MAQVGVAESGDRAAFDYRQLWWLGSGFLGVMLAFSTSNAFLPIMYAGYFDSRVHSSVGRRLPFVVVAVPVAALTFAGIPFAAGALWSLIVVEVVFTAAMHVYRGPVISLPPDHVPPERRSTGNGIINLMGGIGALISFGGLSLVYDHDPRLAFGLGALALLATGVVVLLKADRHPPYVEASAAPHVAPGGGVEPERPRPIRDSYGGVRLLARTIQALPLIADLGGRNRIGFYVGMYYLFTMVGNMLGPSIIGGAMDLFGDRGLFYGSAAASAAGFVLLRRGQLLLPAPPEGLARRSVELPTD